MIENLYLFILKRSFYFSWMFLITYFWIVREPSYKCYRHNSSPAICISSLIFLLVHLFILCIQLFNTLYVLHTIDVLLPCYYNTIMNFIVYSDSVISIISWDIPKYSMTYWSQYNFVNNCPNSDMQSI